MRAMQPVYNLPRSLVIFETAAFLTCVVIRNVGSVDSPPPIQPRPRQNLNMKVVALISGGKDSCFNMMQCVAEGHQIVALANLAPAEKDEVDSYMYQTVGHEAVQLYSQAMQLPLFRRTLQGRSVEVGRDYRVNAQDEVEDLHQLLLSVKEELEVEAVSVGAILSDYQRVRVENVCSRLGLSCLAFLWRREQSQLLQEMVACHLHAIIIKVASLGLEPGKHLGKDLAQMEDHLNQMNKKYGLNVCGEGGEYETFTLDCPLFTKRIVVDRAETVIHSDDAFAPVAYLKFREMHLEEKTGLGVPLEEYLRSLPMQQGSQLLRELEGAGEGGGVEAPPPHAASWPTEVAVAAPSGCGQAETGPRRRLVGPYLWVTGVQSPSSAQSLETAVDCAMKCLKAELEAGGMGMKDAVFVSLYVRDMQEFKRINAVYCQYFGLNPPARACVEVDLTGEGALLRLDCLACGLASVRHMHVQSLSHWASANIGPYSQAAQAGELLLLAGQIALVPSTLALLEGGGGGGDREGVGAQARLSLRHVERVLAAMHAGTGLDCMVQALAYVTRREDLAPVRAVWEAALNRPAAQEARRGAGGAAAVRTRDLTLAVVPGLPKGARVEWQVVALTPALSQPWTWRRETEQVVVGGCSVCSQACGYPQEGGGSGRVVTLKATAGLAGLDGAGGAAGLQLEVVLEAMLECLQTTWHQLLQATGPTDGDRDRDSGGGGFIPGLMAVRIFYSQRILTSLLATHINSAFQKIQLRMTVAAGNGKEGGGGSAGNGGGGSAATSLPVPATVVPVNFLSGNLLIEFSALHFS